MAPTGLNPQDTVTILFVSRNASAYQPRGGYSSWIRFAPLLEHEVVGCVSNALHDVYPTVRIVPPDAFRREAFPETDPAAVPTEPWERIVNDAKFRKRISPLGIRYLIAVNVSGGRTPMEYDVRYGRQWSVIGWFGNHWSSMNATVVDLAHARVPGSMTASVTSDEAAGLGLLYVNRIAVPFPYWDPPVSTFKEACKELGKKVASFLTSEDQLREHPGLATTN